MVGLDACTAVAGRNSWVLARMRRAGTGGTRAALLTLGAAMALAGGRAADADGAVVGWGDNDYGQCSTPAGLASVTQIAGGGTHTIALTGPSLAEQLAAAQVANAKLTAANAQQAAEILLLNARIAILQLGDLNEDGAIDGGDLATLLNSWGTGGK